MLTKLLYGVSLAGKCVFVMLAIKMERLSSEVETGPSGDTVIGTVNVVKKYYVMLTSWK